MALDLTYTAIQIDRMTQSLRERRTDKHLRLKAALAEAKAFQPDAYSAKLNQQGTHLNWILPDVPENPTTSYSPPPLPSDYAVVGVDGSHIDVSRHIPAHCYLINIGGIALKYGAHPNASSFSTPHLYASEDELVIQDTIAPHREETISGALLDAKRTVEEFARLAKELQHLPPTAPALGLVDGSLIMFGMHRHPDFVVRNLVDEGIAEILDDIQQMAAERTLAIASYISLPRSPEIVNALRLTACPYPIANCERLCGAIPTGERPCDKKLSGVLDREIFTKSLSIGERSPVFRSNAPIVQNHYGQHGICFFYLRTEEEIGRVEIPDWIAADETMLGMVHSIILEQCRLGPGYPVALKEAHEQAVVSGADRQYFIELMEAALTEQHLPVYSSEKNISKMRRWL